MDNASRIGNYIRGLDQTSTGTYRLTPAQRRRVVKKDNRAKRRGGEHVHEPVPPCLKCHPLLRLTDGPIKHDHRRQMKRCLVCRPERALRGVPFRPV